MEALAGRKEDVTQNYQQLTVPLMQARLQHNDVFVGIVVHLPTGEYGGPIMVSTESL